MTAVFDQQHPVTGEQLGRRRAAGSSYRLHLAGLLAAEPHATAERRLELQREAARLTRQTAPYTDVTVSFSKSISVLHASIRENARRARQAGDQDLAAWWDAREQEFQDVLQAANRAALRHAETWAGMTRTGNHARKIDGQETGRFEQARITVASWLQFTSRDGDPQDHIHNQVARMVQTDQRREMAGAGYGRAARPAPGDAGGRGDIRRMRAVAPFRRHVGSARGRRGK